MYSKLGNAQIYFYLGWLVLLSYLPFYWYRTRVEDPKFTGAVQPRAGYAAAPSPPAHGE